MFPMLQAKPTMGAIVHRPLFFLFALPMISGTSIAQERSATPRVVDIAWPSGPAGAPLPDPRLDQASDVRFPVLLPPRLLNFRSFRLVAGQLNYSASVRARGATIIVSGTRVATDVPDPETGSSQSDARPDASLPDDRAIELGLTRYGAAYLISVECDAAGDMRCSDDQYVQSLAASLELVGGSRRPPTETPQPPRSDAGTAAAPIPDFAWRPAGELIAGSGSGVRGTTVYAAGIRFPVERPPAYLNSQVWRYGGAFGGGGSWRDPRNYSYPWQDNFCELRSRATPACPSGRGHQGVDIRPADARDVTHWAVAVEAGRISSVGSYSVILTGNSGTQYRYLHLEMRRLAVSLGASVTPGQRIGLISNDFGATPTTVHLHFEMLQNLNGRGLRHVPPYMSLVRAYERLE